MPPDELDRYYGGAQFVPRRAAADPEIPTGQPNSSSSEQPSGALDIATRALKRAATDFNPLMYLRTLQDAPKMVFNASPLNAAMSLGAVPLNLIQNKGAELLHSAFGDEEDAQAARARNANPQPANFQLPMSSATGQLAQDALYKAIDESKIAGAVGMPHIPSRGFTPNDLRVAAGNVGRVGKQVRELPTDFQNAQSGLTRIDRHWRACVGCQGAKRRRQLCRLHGAAQDARAVAGAWNCGRLFPRNKDVRGAP